MNTSAAEQQEACAAKMERCPLAEEQWASRVMLYLQIIVKKKQTKKQNKTGKMHKIKDIIRTVSKVKDR